MWYYQYGTEINNKKLMLFDGILKQKQHIWWETYICVQFTQTKKKIFTCIKFEEKILAFCQRIMPSYKRGRCTSGIEYTKISKQITGLYFNFESLNGLNILKETITNAISSSFRGNFTSIGMILVRTNREKSKETGLVGLEQLCRSHHGHPFWFAWYCLVSSNFKRYNRNTTKHKQQGSIKFLIPIGPNVRTSRNARTGSYVTQCSERRIAFEIRCRGEQSCFRWRVSAFVRIQGYNRSDQNDSKYHYFSVFKIILYIKYVLIEK